MAEKSFCLENENEFKCEALLKRFKSQNLIISTYYMNNGDILIQMIQNKNIYFSTSQK